MTTEVINKINITAEAAFDYEMGPNLGKLDKKALKTGVEEYIANMNSSGRLLYEHYFRCGYFDECSGKLLMLFLYRSDRFSIMQTWDLAGICMAKHWTEDLEESGQIRSWLKTKIADLPDTEDWVVRYRVNQILKETEEVLLRDVIKEVKNAFDNGRDKESAERLALLQSIHYKFKQRKRANRKTKRNRESGSIIRRNKPKGN